MSRKATSESSEKELSHNQRLQSVIRHIKIVQDACQKLGLSLIDKGEKEFGRNLIANSMIHDNSKFFGIEWDCLHPGKDKKELEMALRQHVTTNKHHPEYWGGVEKMPEIFLAEMVCDWYARSVEFGTDLREWIKNTAYERFEIPPKGKLSKKIKEFLDLLLEKPF